MAELKFAQKTVLTSGLTIPVSLVSSSVSPTSPDNPYIYKVNSTRNFSFPYSLGTFSANKMNYIVLNIISVHRMEINRNSCNLQNLYALSLKARIFLGVADTRVSPNLCAKLFLSKYLQIR